MPKQKITRLRTELSQSQSELSLCKNVNFNITWPRPESNRDYNLRRIVSYPLNDGITSYTYVFISYQNAMDNKGIQTFRTTLR